MEMVVVEMRIVDGFWRVLDREKIRGLKKPFMWLHHSKQLKNVHSPQRGSTIVSFHLVPEKRLGFGLRILPTLSDGSDEMLPILSDP